MDMPCEASWPTLTAGQAVLLAEQAFNAGRRAVAEFYLDVAYAIFDTNVSVHARRVRPAQMGSAMKE